MQQLLPVHQLGQVPPVTRDNAPELTCSWPPPHPPDHEVGPSGSPVSTTLGVSVTASGALAVSASTSEHIGLGPSVVPATSASGIPATLWPSLVVPATGVSGAPATHRQSSALLWPPRCPPDHGTCTLAVSVPQASEPQAPLTRGGNEVTTAGSLHTLDIHRLPDHATSTRGCTDISPAYNNSVLDIYRAVTAHGQPNFRGACIPLPSNFDFHQWSSIAYTPADEQVLQYLKCGSPPVLKDPSRPCPLVITLQLSTILAMSKLT